MGGILGSLTSMGLFMRKLFSQKSLDLQVIQRAFAQPKKQAKGRKQLQYFCDEGDLESSKSERGEKKESVAEKIYEALRNIEMVKFGRKKGIYCCTGFDKESVDERKTFV